MSEREIIYIAGYGRSGSTLLCAVLGANVSSCPVGEFKGIFDHYLKDRNCSCGSTLRKCTFWHGVMSEFQNVLPDISIAEAAEITTKMESYKNWLSVRHRNTELEKRYGKIWQTMINIVCEQTGCNTVVDASKSSSVACNRVAVLSRLCEIKQVHLVRDPRSVMSSMLAAQKRRLERHGIKPTMLRGVKTLLSWSVTNLYIHAMSILGIQRVDSRVSYEMLTNQPLETFAYLNSTLGVDVQKLKNNLAANKPFSAGHIFSGDLQRMHGDYFIKSTSPKWPQELSVVQRYIAFVTFPLARAYGFMRMRESKQLES